MTYENGHAAIAYAGKIYRANKIVHIIAKILRLKDVYF